MTGGCCFEFPVDGAFALEAVRWLCSGASCSSLLAEVAVCFVLGAAGQLTTGLSSDVDGAFVFEIAELSCRFSSALQLAERFAFEAERLVVVAGFSSACSKLSAFSSGTQKLALSSTWCPSLKSSVSSRGRFSAAPLLPGVDNCASFSLPLPRPPLPFDFRLFLPFLCPGEDIFDKLTDPQ